MQEIKDRNVKQEEILRQWIQESSHIVFFGGAGVSTESGIPDFRSQDGLYNQEYAYPPETIISHSFFMRNPEEFYRFYKNKMIYRNAKPNAAHLALAKLEQEGKLKAVITQNIDGLHQMAGSKNVLELHGSIHRNYCMRCGKAYGLEAVADAAGIPRCSCGGIIKPDVVLYEEGYIYIILINCHSVCFCNQRPVNLLLHCFPCIFVEMITDDRDCPTHRYALGEYKAVRIYPQCIRYHPQNGIPVLLPASYIPSRRIAFDD